MPARIAFIIIVTVVLANACLFPGCAWLWPTAGEGHEWDLVV